MGGHATYLPYRGFERPAIKRVYYSGADTVEVGSLLCFKHDATIRTSPTSLTDTFGVTVVKPATANLMLPAGITVNRKVGAGWVDIYDISDTGKFVLILANANWTARTTPVGGVDAQYYAGVHTDATVNVAMFGLAMEAHTAGSTALKLIKLIGQ